MTIWHCSATTEGNHDYTILYTMHYIPMHINSRQLYTKVCNIVNRPHNYFIPQERIKLSICLYTRDLFHQNMFQNMFQNTHTHNTLIFYKNLPLLLLSIHQSPPPPPPPHIVGISTTWTHTDLVQKLIYSQLVHQVYTITSNWTSILLPHPSFPSTSTSILSITS